jgi:hypothetical protein
MNPSSMRRLPTALWRGLRCAARCGLLFAFGSALHSELRADGSVEGRVFNTTNGRFINNARITIDGVAQETFTDEQGFYRVAANLRGRERRNAFTGASVEPGTYQYKNPRDYIDVSVEYRLTRHMALFASARDLLGIYNDFERYGPSTPRYARLLLRQDIGTLVNVGLKAQF